MAGAAIFFVVVVFLLVVAGGLSVMSRQLKLFKFIERILSNSFTGPLKQLAKVKSGSFMKSGQEPRVYYRADGNSFIVKGRLSNGSQALTVSAFWPGAKFRLRFFHDKWSPGAKKFIGMQDLEIGAREFDQRFVIQSDRTDDMLAVLLPEVQSLIMKCGGDINLSILAGQIELTRNAVRLTQQFLPGATADRRDAVRPALRCQGRCGLPVGGGTTVWATGIALPAEPI